MATVQTSAPSIEPITLEEAKAHLRIDTPDDDTLIQSLIMTSRLHVEVALGLTLLTQTWSCFFDRWPSDRSGLDAITLPLSPVASVDAVRVYADDGTFLNLPLAGFSFDLVSRHPRIMRKKGTMTPEPGRRLNGIEVAITCGFGAQHSDVPAPIRQALLLLVAHWYEHRDPGEIGTAEARVPAAVSALLGNYLPVRL